METDALKCSIGILTMRLVLRNYSLLIYDEVRLKIEQIYRMIPPEFEVPRRSQHGLVDGLGKLLRYVGGVATLEDVKKMQGRLSLLENYISDNQQGTRTELGRLLVAEKLLSRKMDLMLADVRGHALEVIETLHALLGLDGGEKVSQPSRSK